jgi:hypothetical protein
MQRDSEDEWQEWYRLTPMERWRERTVFNIQGYKVA